MENVGSWVSYIEAFMDASRPSSQQVAILDAISALVKKDFLTLEALVREMELYLTTSDQFIRARGILLLAEIISRLKSKPLDNSIICSVTEFFCSRLEDWQALRGALMGCLALLRREKDVGVMAGNGARAIAQSLIKNIQVQSLALRDRKLCFEVLQSLIDLYSKDVGELGEDLIYFVCDAIDEEKDPRCLLLTFHLVESIMQLFNDQNGLMDSFVKDLFDILGRYFPIYFTHEVNEDVGISRDALSTALMHAFSSTKSFEPFVIPLLLDKLSSTLPSAKIDSLKCLKICLVNYGADRMEKHSGSIWSAVKIVIFKFAPHTSLLALSTEFDVNMGSVENQVFREALQCLGTAILVLNTPKSDHFLSLVLEDKDVAIAFESICVDRLHGGIDSENVRQLSALASIFSVLSKNSTSCCGKVFQKFFTPLMITLGVSSSSQHKNGINNCSESPKKLNSGALFLCVEILSSCRVLTDSKEGLLPQQPVSTENSWLGFLQNFVEPLSYIFESILLKSEFTRVPDDDNILGLVHGGVKGLQVLATFSGSYNPVRENIFKDVLMILLSVIADMSDKTYVWKLALKALVQIGLTIEESQDPEKEICYHNIVVERILSPVSLNDSNISLALTLDAIFEIGATGMKVMHSVTQVLEKTILSKLVEACVEGNLLSAQNLVLFLKSYTDNVMPWYQTKGCLNEVGMRFAQNVWTQIEEEKIFSSDMPIQVQDLLNCLMAAMKLAVSGCATEDQSLIIVKAHKILLSYGLMPSRESFMSATSSEVLPMFADFVSLSSRDEWLISLFASVVISLHPQTPIPDTKSVLMTLKRSSQEGNLPAAQALASIVNKWPENVNSSIGPNFYPLGGVADVIDVLDLSNMLCSSIFGRSTGLPNVSSSKKYAINVLAWIGKGLLMRGHEKVREVAMFFLKCLLSSQDVSASGKLKTEDGEDENERSLVRRSAADAFHILLSDSEACLDKKYHAMIKPLYKQRFFSTMTPILLSSMKESGSANTRSLLYRAFGHIISDTPLRAVIDEAKKVISWLPDAISVMSSDILNKDLIYSLLLVLSGVLMDENGKEAFIENMHLITPALVKLISYPHLMVVRETALQCLVAMSGLPHTRIYPFRPQVLRSVTSALNDNKRAVRKEAVRCRQAWASMASRSLRF